MLGPKPSNPPSLWFDESLSPQDTGEFRFLPEVLDSGSAIYRLNQETHRYFYTMVPVNRIRGLMQLCWI